MLKACETNSAFDRIEKREGMILTQRGIALERYNRKPALTYLTSCRVPSVL